MGRHNRRSWGNLLRRDVVQDRDTLPAELSIRSTCHQVRIAVFSPECRYCVGCNLPRHSSGQVVRCLQCPDHPFVPAISPWRTEQRVSLEYGRVQPLGLSRIVQISTFEILPTNQRRLGSIMEWMAVYPVVSMLYTLPLVCFVIQLLCQPQSPCRPITFASYSWVDPSSLAEPILFLLPPSF